MALKDGTLTGTTTQDQSGAGDNGNKGLYHKAPRLEPHHQMLLWHCNRRLLLPAPTGLSSSSSCCSKKKWKGEK